MGNKEQLKNVPLLMAKQKYLKRFERLLVDLQDFSINGYFKQTLQRFRACIQPSGTRDESQLPFLSYTGFSRKANKNQCVLCVLSVVIQNYWVLCNGDLKLEDVIDNYLHALESYAKHGRKAYKIAGPFPKFYLERI